MLHMPIDLLLNSNDISVKNIGDILIIHKKVKYYIAERFSFPKIPRLYSFYGGDFIE
jgi:hypothetical protein